MLPYINTLTNIDLNERCLNKETLPSDKSNLQSSFTKGRSASHATVILFETLAEAKDSNRTLLMASLDIQKAFVVISHNHLLRKLYLAGLPSIW